MADNTLLSAALALGGVVVAPENTLVQRLAERRIDELTIAAHGIQPCADGWIYPTPGGGFRWKAATKDAAIKYLWCDADGRPGEKPPGDDLYCTADIIQAVTASGGACWLVSGEADRWAMYAAGIPHVISGFTESAVTPALVPFLLSAGVLVVYIAPDLDDTGRAWAGKVATALHGTGIDLSCRELPADLGEKGDIGKLWQSYAGRLSFERYLSNLPIWRPEITHKLPAILPTDGETVPAEYKQAIADLLGVDNGFDTDGWARHNSRCPFHDDGKHADARLSELAGLYCYVCGRVYLWNELGRHFGLGTVNQWQADHVNDQLSTEAREMLISSKLTGLSRFLELMYQAGLRGAIASRTSKPPN